MRTSGANSAIRGKRRRAYRSSSIGLFQGEYLANRPPAPTDPPPNVDGSPSRRATAPFPATYDAEWRWRISCRAWRAHDSAAPGTSGQSSRGWQSASDVAGRVNSSQLSARHSTVVAIGAAGSRRDVRGGLSGRSAEAVLMERWLSGRRSAGAGRSSRHRRRPRMCGGTGSYGRELQLVHGERGLSTRGSAGPGGRARRGGVRSGARRARTRSARRAGRLAAAKTGSAC